MHRNHKTCIISDGKAETRDWRMGLWRKRIMTKERFMRVRRHVLERAVVSCFAKKWYRRREDCGFVKVESSAMLVVETPSEVKSIRLNKTSAGVWRAKEINQAPLWARAAALYTWTDWNWNTEVVDRFLARNIMRIYLVGPKVGNSSRFNLPSRFEARA